jgi:hypothetical protein
MGVSVTRLFSKGKGRSVTMHRPSTPSLPVPLRYLRGHQTVIGMTGDFADEGTPGGQETPTVSSP